MKDALEIPKGLDVMFNFPQRPDEIISELAAAEIMKATTPPQRSEAPPLSDASDPSKFWIELLVALAVGVPLVFLGGLLLSFLGY